MAPKFPDKWKDYSPFGEIISNTNILISKVPLSGDFFGEPNDTTFETQFTPAALADMVKNKFNKQVGLVLDLTFTSRYYHPTDICQLGSDYYKLPVEGTQVPNEGCVQQCMRVIESFNQFVLDGGNPDQFNPRPEENQTPDKKPEEIEPKAPEASVKPVEEKPEAMEIEMKKPSEEAHEENLFKIFENENLPDISAANMTCLTSQEVQKYQTKMKDCKYLIVIHCTHGVNRAGYMAIRYLIDRLGLAAQDAIRLVGEARGHSLARESYLNVLLDAETIAYAREQARYSYLIDIRKYWKYVPGKRFQSRAFDNWRQNLKRKLPEENSTEKLPAEQLAVENP